MVKKELHDPVLSKIKDIIIRTVSPDKIILFGSRARGDAGPESDYDILVVKKGIGNERIVSRKINYELFNEKIGSEVDIIATSMEKWERNRDNIAFIYKNIDSEGILLYE